MKIHLRYLILLLILLLPTTVYAQGQANTLTIPAADNRYLKLDGSNDPITGTVQFTTDIYGNTITCGDVSSLSVDFTILPIIYNNTAYTWADSGCGVGTILNLVSASCEGGGGGYCSQGWNTCDNQTTISAWTVADENYIKNKSLSAYIGSFSGHNITFYGFSDTTLFDEASDNFGGVITWVLKVTDILEWDSTTCEWGYNNGATATLCSANCSGTDGEPTFEGATVQKGSGAGKWAFWTGVDCGESCGENTFSGNPSATNETFISGATYKWEIDGETGNFGTAGTVTIGRAYTLPAIGGTASQVLTFPDSGTTLGWGGIECLADRTDGDTFLCVDKSSGDPTIEDYAGNSYIKLNQTDTTLDMMTDLVFPTTYSAQFRDETTKIYSSEEGVLNFVSNATTTAIFDFGTKDGTSNVHTVYLDNGTVTTPHLYGKLLDAVLDLTEDDANERHVAFAFQSISNTTTNKDSFYNVGVSSLVSHNSIGKIKALYGLELDSSSNSGRERVSEFSYADSQYDLEFAGMSSTTHNIGDMISNQSSYVAHTYMRDGPGDSGQAGVTSNLSSYRSDIRLQDNINGNVAAYVRDFYAHRTQFYGNSFVEGYVTTLYGGAPLFQTGSTGYTEEYRGVTINSGSNSGTGDGTKNFYGVTIRAQEDIKTDIIGVEVEDQSGSGATGDIYSIKVADDILALTTNDTENFNINIQRSRSEYTPLVEDDKLFGIEVYGFDDIEGDYNESAAIRFYADADQGYNDTPGRIEFYTTADGESTMSKRLTIKNNLVVVGNITLSPIELLGYDDGIYVGEDGKNSFAYLGLQTSSGYQEATLLAKGHENNTYFWLTGPNVATAAYGGAQFGVQNGARDIFTVYTSGDTYIYGGIEVGGALNHDGTTIGFFGTTPTTKQTALTANLTSTTSAGSGTPDYAIQALTNTTPYGFATKDEGETLIEVVINLQTRVYELETKLKAYGLLQ